jgi:hypothetical protein
MKDEKKQRLCAHDLLFVGRALLFYGHTPKARTARADATKRRLRPRGIKFDYQGIQFSTHKKDDIVAGNIVPLMSFQRL